MTPTNFVIAVAFVAGGALQVAAEQAAPSATATAPRAAAGDLKAAPKLPPGARANALTTIQGNALDSANHALPSGVVRLRDARLGRIVGTQVTDRSGLFTFRSVEPGSYIVEIMAADESTVLAASQLINVNSGEVMSAVVKLPFRIPPFAGVLGNTRASAAAIAVEAAAAGVLATSISGTPISPLR